MSADQTRAANDQLQFDRVASRDASADPAIQQPTVSCSACAAPIRTDYYHVNGKTVCERCHGAITADAAATVGWGRFGRAALFGAGAAIAGAAIYYAVIAITEFEIGIVAILIGYMVGYSVRKGAGGRGARRMQILAVALTYWAVGLAYAPLSFKGMTEGSSTSATASTSHSAADSSTSARPVAVDSATPSAQAQPAQKDDDMSVPLALIILIGMVFALPVIAIAGTLPGGLISAFIIFIGMRQAWRMTGAAPIKISGPYRVGTQPNAAAG